MMQPAEKSVGIWVRVSTEEQVKGESPEHHERRCRAYAEARGWAVATVYDLSAVSGTRVLDHPETRRMTDDLRAGRISGLIFSKLARLARTTKELLSFAEFFEEHHGDLISLGEAIDTSTPSGKLFFTILAAMAQFERDELIDRVKASIKTRAQMGKPLGGAAPFGYLWKDKKLELHPDEAPIRRELYELFQQHRRVRTIARMLNDKGYRTRKGALFSDTTVRRLLEDPTAKGVQRLNYTTSTGDGLHWELKPEDEWIYAPCPAIVSEELWEECNQVLRANKQKQRKARRAVHIFSGRTFCACGGKMYPTSNSKVVKYRCQMCRRKITTEDLEMIFQSRLHGFSVSEDEVATFLCEGDRMLSGREALLRSLERERERTSRESEKLLGLVYADALSAEGFAKRHKPLEERLSQLDEEIPRLRGELDALRLRHVSSSEVVSQAQSLAEKWFKLPREDRRAIVETMVSEVVVDEDDISIELFGAPPDLPPPVETHAGTSCSLENAVTRQRNPRGSSPPAGRSGRER